MTGSDALFASGANDSASARSRSSRPPDCPGPGAWGPRIRGGRRWRWLRSLLVMGMSVMVVLGGAGVATGYLLYRTAASNLTRVPLRELAAPTDPDAPLNVLVVGSDSRQGLSEQRRQELELGSFSGQRSDTMLLVSITPDRQHATVISFPRDLLVYDDGDPTKLANTFAGGADNVVQVLRETFDIPIHHYVQVSVPGFLGLVETVGEVELCLDEPLVDEKSGADLPAGCQQLTPEDALSYVRSRQGARGDFKRIERQQRFLQAMQDKVVAAGTLMNLPRLFRLVEEAAANVVTDEQLGVGQMRRLAQDLRGLAGGDVPMTFVPGYPRSILGASFVIGYRPGVLELFEAVREGEPVDSRGPPDERDEVGVVLWHAGNLDEAGIVESTLHWAGYGITDVGVAPVANSATTVYAAPGSEQHADWVAATLGAHRRAWPDDEPVPEGASVAVAIGEDTDLQRPELTGGQAVATPTLPPGRPGS